VGSLEKVSFVFETTQTNACPEPLVRSIAVEGKSDQERFESLNWGLRTLDHWYLNDIDRPFGDGGQVIFIYLFVPIT